MDIKARLDQILEQWNLLNHPFYQAWSEGTLPMDALRVYAPRIWGVYCRAANGLGNAEG